jgi:hypothetical protein
LIQENLSALAAEVEGVPDTNRAVQEYRQAVGRLTPEHVKNPIELTRPHGDDQDEEAKAKAMLESGKGRMVLTNGNVIENGRMIIRDKSKQLGKSLPALSTVLAHHVKTFKVYVPLPVFDKLWLTQDRQAWEGREPPSESKLNKSGSTLRVYGGDPPINELTMQYDQWLDCFGLFVRYIKDAGWITLAEDFAAHKEIVMEMRDSMGWMVALRYCRKVRQGVMRVTVDKEIINVSERQEMILEEVKQICENNGERSFRTNPYAPGGVKDHLDPETGLSKSSKTSYMSTKKTAVGVTRLEETSTGNRREKRPWLPPAEWEAKLRAEGKWVERRGEKGRKRGAYEDRGRDGFRKDKRGRSRSRSRERYDARKH